MTDESKTAEIDTNGISSDELCENTESCSESDDMLPSTSKSTKPGVFYTKAQQYWSTIPATVDGMLGGFGIIHTIDVQGSQAFFSEIFKLNTSLGKGQALDCGSGIGRVTKNVLMPIFDRVDMVEQDSNFTKAATKYIGTSISKLGQIYNCGLQEFTPELDKYDVIWSQWVLSHLTNEDLISFLKRLKLGLRKNGLFILKENVTSTDKVEIDDVDSSVTRPLKAYKKILRRSGYRIIKAVRQTNLPKGLYPVYMIACFPIKN